jgi:hypothetical protein
MRGKKSKTIRRLEGSALKQRKVRQQRKRSETDLMAAKTVFGNIRLLAESSV